MDTQELLKKVRKIEIRTKGLSRHLFSGGYHSAFKGKGIAFSEVREYMPGDEIRAIDWNVTAKLNHPYVKVFEEERELTVMLLVDMSGSENFGSGTSTKRDFIAELTAVLSFSAVQNNDKVGAIFFTDKIEKFIPPKKGRMHILRIISELLNFTPESNGTDIALAARHFTNVQKKRAIGFLISDFLSENYEDALKIANKRHDIVALQVYDKYEEELPDLGLAKVYDPETGIEKWIDFSSQDIRESHSYWWNRRQAELDKLMSRAGIDKIKIQNGMSYVAPLMNFFKKRGSRR